jgi:hypothetical protein
MKHYVESSRHHPCARYVAVMLNILILLWLMIVVILSMLNGAQYFVSYLAINLAVSIVFIALRGIWGEIGCGMLIAWLSIPVGLFVMVGGFALGHVIVG